MSETEKSYEEIAEILKQKDPILKGAIASSTIQLHPEPTIDIFVYLLRSIVSQQLSVKVAAVIWGRFLDLFPNEQPLELLILEKTDEELRSVGLSRQKANYLRNVAAFSVENGMTFEMLSLKTDKEIIDYLTTIKGVGKWTVQMVLMFPMDRPDVFPIDDLGIQTKLIQYYKLEGEKKEIRNRMTEIAEEWRPYRSLASKMLWRATSL